MFGYVMVGHESDSEHYVSIKEKRCSQIGIEIVSQKFEEDIKQEELLEVIDRMNEDPKLNAIMV